MRIANELEKVCHVCQKHFDELCEGKDKIYAFSIELESQSIWGGLGDKDKDKLYYISKKGWEYNIFEEEFGHYPRNIIQDYWGSMSSKDVEKDLNSDIPTMYEVESVIDFCKKIRKQYPDEFK